MLSSRNPLKAPGGGTDDVITEMPHLQLLVKQLIMVMDIRQTFRVYAKFALLDLKPMQVIRSDSFAEWIYLWEFLSYWAQKGWKQTRLLMESG